MTGVAFSEAKQNIWLTPKVGPQWDSFDKMRLDDGRNEKLASLGRGVMGELGLKGGRSVMLVEKGDFQTLLASNREIERLRNGMRVVVSAVKLVEKHPDDQDTVNHLIEVVMALGITPTLATSQGHTPVDFQDVPPLEDEDEVLDPAEARRVARWENH